MEQKIETKSEKREKMGKLFRLENGKRMQARRNKICRTKPT